MGVIGHVLVRACVSNADKVVTATALILVNQEKNTLSACFLPFKGNTVLKMRVSERPFAR